MEIISPNSIGNQIAGLIARSNEKFYAVTAWIDLSNWINIIRELKLARDRGVIIKFYFRDIKEQDFHILLKLGIELYQVKRLHTKFYLNEKEIIVSSMNFIEASDLYSIDIGLHYKDSDTYNKFYHYFLKYINGQNSDYIDFLVDHKNSLKDLQNYLSDRFTDSTINSTETYLFSKDLIPIFHVFIMPNEISLKFPAKNPSQDKIIELTNKLKSLIKNEIRTKEQSEEYNYCTWDINTMGNSTTDFVNIISHLRHINSSSLPSHPTL